MSVEITDSGATVVSGTRDTEAARLLALRAGLSIEIKTGMKLSRGRSASQIITEDILRPLGEIGPREKPQKRRVYNLFNNLLVENGFENRPLPMS